MEAGWQSSQPSCFTMQREPKAAWDNSAPHGLESAVPHPPGQQSQQHGKTDGISLTENRRIGKAPGQHLAARDGAVEKGFRTVPTRTLSPSSSGSEAGGGKLQEAMGTAQHKASKC